jgi:CPA1 family monovalent cation:H+ antiporter
LTLTPNVELVITGLLGVMLVGSIVSRKVRLPYTLVLVFMGIIFAASSISSLTGINSFFNNFVDNLFTGLVLPPLLFESMMNIKSSELKSTIRPSILLATVGVVVATLVGGLLLWKVAGLSAYTSFLFSALISPTDTATVLEVFRRVRVPRRLATLMDTEAAFNDATGIVVFSLVLASSSVGHLSLIPAIFAFAYTFGGGAAVGLAMGFGVELISTFVSDSLTETILTVSGVYGSYAVATTLGFSGLVAVAVAGLYYGNLTIRSVVEPAARETVKSFWQVLAFVANSIAFLFIGLNTNLLSLAQGLPLIAVAYLAVTVARLASVYPILVLFGKAKEKTRKWVNVAVLGGMRGAISVVLVASIPSAVSSKGTLVTAVLGVVFISLVLQGPLLSRYIKRNFPQEQTKETEALTTRLSKALNAIETLNKLKEEGKISDNNFALELEEERNRLAVILSEINNSVGTGDVMKSRAHELYTSIVALPKTKAMQILRHHRVDKPINDIIDKSTKKEEAS